MRQSPRAAHHLRLSRPNAIGRHRVCTRVGDPHSLQQHDNIDPVLVCLGTAVTDGVVQPVGARWVLSDAARGEIPRVKVGVEGSK